MSPSDILRRYMESQGTTTPQQQYAFLKAHSIASTPPGRLPTKSDLSNPAFMADYTASFVAFNLGKIDQNPELGKSILNGLGLDTSHLGAGTTQLPTQPTAPAPTATPPTTTNHGATLPSAPSQPLASATLPQGPQPPTIALQPGSTNTAAVKQLQDYLVSRGYMTQAQVQTGYGTYGPQTTAAVKAFQAAHQIDNTTGPGYWEPKTIASLQGVTTSATPPTNTQGGTSTSPPTDTFIAPTTGQGNAYDPAWATYGVTPDTWNNMNATQQATVSAVLGIGKSMYSATGNKYTVEQGLAFAASDPNLIAKYGDAAKLDNQAFQQSLEALRVATTTTAQQNATKFQNERAQLAEQFASQGQAYSGFRNLAQQQLGQQESAVIQSSDAQNKVALQNLTSAFEARYGSAATPSASLGYMNPLTGQPISLSGQYAGVAGGDTTISSNPLGGITGSQPIAKQADITKLAGDYVAGSAVPDVIKA